MGSLLITTQTQKQRKLYSICQGVTHAILSTCDEEDFSAEYDAPKRNKSLLDFSVALYIYIQISITLSY